MTSSEKIKKSRTHQSLLDSVGVDELARALSFLGWKEVMRSRACRKFKQAAALAFRGEGGVICEIKTHRDYQSLHMLARTFPELSTLHIQGSWILSDMLHFPDGDDPVALQDPEVTGGTTPLDFNVLSAFSNLQHLWLCEITANGRYPRLLSMLTGLKSLLLMHTNNLKLELSEIRRNCPLLEELMIHHDPDNLCVTGEIGILSEMQNLESLVICGCPRVTGDAMQLAGSSLVYLSLLQTGVTLNFNFDSIGRGDFSELTSLRVPGCLTVTNAEEAISAVATVCRLEKRGIQLEGRSISLSQDSADRYPTYRHYCTPPDDIEVVRAGPRKGWRWCGIFYIERLSSCEINWLDPEPLNHQMSTCGM